MFSQPRNNALRKITLLVILVLHKSKTLEVASNKGARYSITNAVVLEMNLADPSGKIAHLIRVRFPSLVIFII